MRASGERLHPFGADADGILIYSPDGWVSAVLSARDRKVETVRSLQTASRASVEEKVQAFDSYMSYAGRFRVEGTTVVHEIAVSLAPGLIGTEMRREARFDGESLELSFEVEGRKETSSYQLHWNRPKAG